MIMDIKRIYFDMDGVLADFERGVAELAGITPINQNDKTPAQDDEMWKAIRKVEHFYDRLEPMPGAIDMFNRIYAKYGEKCEILTGIPKPKRGIVSSGPDKTHWVRRILSEDIEINIVYRAEKKEFCIGKEYVLIDDLEKNIREWEQCGGTGILFENWEDAYSKLCELVNMNS